MQAVGKKQTQAVTRLEELYTRRSRERDRGAEASPVEMAKITNELSSALSEVARTAGEQRMLAFGITPPQQRTHGIKDIKVPPLQPPPK